MFHLGEDKAIRAGLKALCVLDINGEGEPTGLLDSPMHGMLGRDSSMAV